jgi:hypothetical protein
MKLSDIPDGEIIGKRIEDTPQADKTTKNIQTIDVKKIENKEINGKAGELKPLTKTPKLKITPYMEKWVMTAVDLVTDSPVEISAKCNITRQSWYTWMKLPGFSDWFYEQYKAKRKQWIPRLDAMGMARAPKNFDYWKAMNVKAGDMSDGNGNVSITGEKVVAILGGITNYNKQDTTTDKQDIQP